MYNHSDFSDEHRSQKIVKNTIRYIDKNACTCEYTVVPRDTIVSDYVYFGLRTDSRRNICFEIRMK